MSSVEALAMDLAKYFACTPDYNTAATVFEDSAVVTTHHGHETWKLRDRIQVWRAVTE